MKMRTLKYKMLVGYSSKCRMCNARNEEMCLDPLSMIVGPEAEELFEILCMDCFMGKQSYLAGQRDFRVTQ